VIPAVVMLILMALAIGYQALIAIDVALLVAWGLLHQANKRLGGVTGDVFGCLIETVEWVVLIVFCF
jgi:adenosylcobinamide-GDP ribazoletransferase